HGYTRRYVESVLRWQRRYADQAAVWRTADAATPEDGWSPARTRIATPKAADETVEAQIAAKPRPQRRLVWRRADVVDRVALDDFASGRVARILGQQRAMDDFSPVVRWWQG
ncbi:MAG: hypothetical protein QF582_20415, partial [Alphaproteobacteria bacterium]|nr:hypothetical protein [Alphaproteobacteria bacterium]